MSKGMVYLVGAGPGDEMLVTLRAIEALQRADCVIYDGLANEALLAYARPTAEKISVRKRTGPRPWTQRQIDALLLEKAQQGNTVVRLKGGDPGLFGRAPEEAALCAAHGVPFEIVPGITAGLAAAAYSGIFLTDREHASQVVFVTGREAATKTEPRLDYGFLAGFDGTIVLYMAMGNLEEIAAALIDGGKDAATPVAVVQNATTPRQRLLKSDLGHAAQACREQGFGAPSIVIIGPTAAGDERYNWFMHRPLFGKRIVITRDAAGNAVFAATIAAAGGEAIRFDGIRIVDRSDTPAAQEALARLAEYDWIVFTSANGVRHAFQALQAAGKDARAFGSAKVACIGRQTADVLAGFGIRADFVPGRFTSEALAEELAAAGLLAGQRIVLLRSGIAPRDLVEALLARGCAAVDDVAVYTVEEGPAEGDAGVGSIIERIRAGQVDWITFTSSSTVRAFFKCVATEDVCRAGVRIGSIGPVATATLRAMGIEPTVEADVHTVEGLVSAMAAHEQSRTEAGRNAER